MIRIKTTKGLDIPINGQPEGVIESGTKVASVALLGQDYIGLKPRMLVKVGEQVQLGQPLFVDKHDPTVNYTAPGSGTVTAINRGARRALLSVVIELTNTETNSNETLVPPPGDVASMNPDDIRAALYSTGLWTSLRTRPYNKVPRAGTRPESIFVTAVDTRPLSAEPALVAAEYKMEFAAGLNVLSILTPGRVHVCTGPDWDEPVAESESLQHCVFEGPHPAGLPGTHIHHINPVGANSMVWHIGYQDVIALGKYFATGKLWTERTVALSGTGFARPRLVRTRLGANLHDLTSGETDPSSSNAMRIISGCPLAGRTATETEGYLGRYHQQVTSLLDTGKRRLFGWLGLLDSSYSFASRLSRREGHAARHDFTTAAHGRPAALIAIDAFDRVIPMDVLTVPLLRSLLIRDTDQAQALGCLEFDGEDLALCSFLCPGKNDYGAALEVNLEQIERDG